MVVDFLNTAAHLLLALLFLRWVQMKLPRDNDFNKALSYLLH
jgi:hypothetical protein